MRYIALVMLVACCGTATAAEQPATWPDPATVTVPNLSFKPGTQGDDEEYFYFHRDGVSFEAARADIQECTAYSADLSLNPEGPQYIPLGGDPNHLEGTFNNWMWHTYGLVGAVMGGFINDAVLAATERENTRTCMAFKGYARYAITTALWKVLNKGTPQEVITRFALIASGPKPQTEVLVP